MVADDLDTDDGCTCPPLRSARPGWCWWCLHYGSALAIGMGALTLLLGRGNWMTGVLLVVNTAALAWQVLELCWRYEAMDECACDDAEEAHS